MHNAGEIEPLRNDRPSQAFVEFMQDILADLAHANRSRLNPLLNMENDILTNKTAGALLRDSELELVKHGDKPVDLRTIPPTEWDKYISRDVTLPPFGSSLLRDSPLPLAEKVIHCIEEWTERYHGVTAPYYIAMSLTLQQTGRPWAYVPEAAPFLTGLTLQKE